MQPTLKDWLARKPRGRAVKKRLPRVTKKRAKQNRAYSLLRSAFLRANPICQRCEKKPATDLHHKAGRHEGNFLNPDTYAALCRTCHDECHHRPKEARAAGWFV